MDNHACVRCGSTEYFEALRLTGTDAKEGKTFYTYDLKCTKCGRTDPYTTDNPDLIDPRVALRQALELEGLQKGAVAGQVNAQSDLTGAAEWLEKHGKSTLSPLDAKSEQRKAAGLL